MLHYRAKTEHFLPSKYLWTALFCVLAQNGETCVSVKKKPAAVLKYFTYKFRHCVDGVVFSSTLQTRCVLRVSGGSILVYGQSHTEGSSGGDVESTRLWGVMTVTPMNNASLPPSHPPLFSGRPIARRVPGPSQPSFSPWEISDINRSTCLPYNP